MRCKLTSAAAFLPSQQRLSEASMRTKQHTQHATTHHTPPRCELKPGHNFLFSRAGGGQLTDKALYDMFGELPNAFKRVALPPSLAVTSLSRERVLVHAFADGGFRV